MLACGDVLKARRHRSYGFGVANAQLNASHQLGEFESGVTAALFGAMPAVVLGGLGTIAAALIWMRLFLSLRQVERLE